MEPDPSPEPKISNHSADTQITNKDINSILGVSKKRRKNLAPYFLSKKVIIAVASITTFIFFSSHYFGLI